MKRCFRLLFIIPIATVFAQAPLHKVPEPGLAFQPAVKLADIDTAAFVEWVDGKEQRVQGKDKRLRLPQHIICTDKTEPGYGGISFGITRKPGPRHLRIGFHSAITVGSLLTDGGGWPSVLKPGVAYPGNLNDSSQWIKAQRVFNSDKPATEAGRAQYGLWVFPSGTTTRAIRFTHLPDASDEAYEGWIGGVLVIKDRLTNLAGEAQVAAKSFNQRAPLLVNAISDNWGAWGTRDEKDKPDSHAPVITADTPEWIILSWTKPVTLKGLFALWAGFSTAEVETYTGDAGTHPRNAGDNKWQSVGMYSGIVSLNGVFWPNVLDFGKEISTTAIRIKITGAIKNGGNLQPKAQDGKRVWLGELMALHDLGTQPLRVTVKQAATINNEHPPIAIPFSLKDAGYVTLVIEDRNGVRVRNLIAETWFNAGNDTAWWDGLDDLGRDVTAARHGVYRAPGTFVSPGEYKVRGLVRGDIKTSYEFSVYTTGITPWSTDDHLGGWLANHTPPQAAVFVPAKQSPTGEPAVYLGCFVTEGPDGLAWVDLDGRKKGGKKWVGGAWTAAPFIARDAGDKANAGVYAYVAAVWETSKNSGIGELRVTGLTATTDKPITVHPVGMLAPVAEQTGALPPQLDKGDFIGGLAVYNNLIVVSLTSKNQLLFIDANTGKTLDSTVVEAPRGMAFDDKGGLLVLSGRSLLRFATLQPFTHLSAVMIIKDELLEAPVAVTTDAEGLLYVSDGGTSHQVKVFSANGKLLRSIGKPGVPGAGPYDTLHMNHPAGITIDSRQQLWVTENDFLPKRVSVWSLDGRFIKAFYGPGKYGGGGSLDPQDKRVFYYAEETKGVMEFELNWTAGTSQLKKVLYRKDDKSLPLAFRSAAPETVIHYKGRKYFTNCYNSNPTGGHTTAFLFVERNGLVWPAAAMGRADLWDVLKQEQFKSLWPPNVDLNSKGPKSQAFFSWSDKNGDAQVQPQEVFFRKGATGGVTVMNDLSFCLSVDGKAYQLQPEGFEAQDVPIYSFNKARLLAEGVQPPASSGGNQLLLAPDGWTVAIQGILPFNRYSISGAKNGKALWSYPNLWPGLHASHEAPLPSFPGQLIGPTRLLGGLIHLNKSDAGPLWAINSNHGMVYIFTGDGLFVATLFEPMRSGKRWRMPVVERGMSLKGITLGEENFWPSITQTSEGEVYITDGARSSLVKVEGLENIQRLADIKIALTAEELVRSREWLLKEEAARQQQQGNGILPVMIRNTPIAVDGKLGDWAGAEWVDIDKSGVRANFNSDSKPFDISGAIAVSADKLFAAFRTGDPALLKNSGEMAVAPFKTGGALDLMIGTDPASAADRKAPVAGDLRLLVTMVKGKPLALLYRAVVRGGDKKDKVPFASPWRTIHFDKVEDVSAQIEIAAGKNGEYEISAPLAVLGLKPSPGMKLKGDIGVLRGDGTQTIARVYWSNKATGIVSDVPSEAELTPGLWGTLEFKSP